MIRKRSCDKKAPKCHNFKDLLSCQPNSHSKCIIITTSHSSNTITHMIRHKYILYIKKHMCIYSCIQAFHICTFDSSKDTAAKNIAKRRNFLTKIHQKNFISKVCKTDVSCHLAWVYYTIKINTQMNFF